MSKVIVIAGCGALGSQIAMHLSRPEYQFLLVDDDTVSRENIESLTSAYHRTHIGIHKARALAAMMFQSRGGHAFPAVETVSGPFTPGADWVLVIDTFDNAQARATTCGLSVPTLHVGISAARTGAILWDQQYTLHDDEFPRGENPVCTHQLGAHIIRVTAAIAASIADDFIERGWRRNMIITENYEFLQ